MQEPFRLAQTADGIDLRSADGRAAVGALLREVECADPQIVQRRCAEIELSKLGQPVRAAR